MEWPSRLLRHQGFMDVNVIYEIRKIKYVVSFDPFLVIIMAPKPRHDIYINNAPTHRITHQLANKQKKNPQLRNHLYQSSR